jgi:hypothetical protein
MADWKIFVMDGEIPVKAVTFNATEQQAYDTLDEFAGSSPASRTVELWPADGDRPAHRCSGYAESNGIG